MSERGTEGEGRAHRGSYIGCEHYELRVTARCCAEDLNEAPNASFEALLRHGIVEGFRNKHSADPATAKTVGPAAGAASFGRLQYGAENRGAIWHDRPNAALWLCAARDRHRSGEPDDAFRYFDSLIATGRMLPTADDYEALELDRSARLVDDLPDEARRLVASARAAAGHEITGRLGPVELRLVVSSVPDVGEELFVAVSMLKADDAWLAAILVCLHPDPGELDDWRVVNRLPSGDLDSKRAEIGYSTLLR